MSQDRGRAPATLDAEDLRPLEGLFENAAYPALSAKGAYGIGLSFSRVQLQGAKFDGADLCDADFSGADLRGASFRGANLWHARFGGADLRALPLARANFWFDEDTRQHSLF